jgi:hypothetical protein
MAPLRDYAPLDCRRISGEPRGPVGPWVVPFLWSFTARRRQSAMRAKSPISASAVTETGCIRSTGWQLRRLTHSSSLCALLARALRQLPNRQFGSWLETAFWEITLAKSRLPEGDRFRAGRQLTGSNPHEREVAVPDKWRCRAVDGHEVLGRRERTSGSVS